MGFKTLSLIVTDARGDGGADAQALAAAAALALREDAHLDVYCLGIDAARYDMVPLSGAGVMVESGLATARDTANALAQWVKRALPPPLLKAMVHPTVAPLLGLESTVARLARYSDLVITARPYGLGRDMTRVTLAEAALLATGAPVLVAPETPRDWSQPFHRITVAWNESDESLAAIRSALPFLRAAAHVDLVMVDPPSHSPERSDPGGAISLLLARHGVKVEVSILSRTLPRTADVIARFAADHHADAIVMGAYGHSRLRESILGGATRDMLEAANLPLLMAH